MASKKLEMLTGCLFTAILLIQPSIGCSTTVVGIVDVQKQRIVLAADSKAVLTDSTVRRTCKISANPGCVFALSGLVYVPKLFNLFEIAVVVCGQPGNLRKKADTFVQTAQGTVQRAISSMRSSDPTFYRQEMSKERVIDSLFAGTQDGHLVIFERGLHPTASGILQQTSGDVNDFSPSNSLAMIGDSDQLDAYVSAHPRWPSVDAQIVAEDIVRAEIDSRPETVGPPVASLQIMRGSMIMSGDAIATHWLQPGVCAR